MEAQYENGGFFPLRGRSKLTYVFPWIPKKFKTYKDYSQATVDDLFGADKIAAVRRLEATELQSGIFIQQPNGTFQFQALPRLAQVAPINSIVAEDLDGDGLIDLVCVGNNFGPEPTTADSMAGLEFS